MSRREAQRRTGFPIRLVIEVPTSEREALWSAWLSKPHR
jgi:hypothetical protein